LRLTMKSPLGLGKAGHLRAT